MGKGSGRREREDIRKIRKNWPWSDKPIKTWPRDKNGNLIGDESIER